MSSTNHPLELESLRSQVADLTRALAEQEQAMQAQCHHLEETMRDLREQSNLLRTIIEGTAVETGDEFFASLVTHLTMALHVQYAVIGEVCEGGSRQSAPSQSRLAVPSSTTSNMNLPIRPVPLH